MSVEMLKIKCGILDADIKAAQADIMVHMPSTAAYFKPACKEAAGGGVASLAPSRPSKANKPFRARFDVAREAWRKHTPHQWASKTSDNCRQIHAGRLRRPLTIIDRNPTPLRRQLRPVGLLPCRKDVGLLLHRGFAADHPLATYFYNSPFLPATDYAQKREISIGTLISSINP